MADIQVRGPAPVRIVFDGQSMNLWPPAELSETPYLDGLGPYPARLMRMAGLPGIPFANDIAIINTGWATLLTTAATRLYPQIRNRAGCTDILVMSGGQTDLPDVTGAQAYTRAVTYADAARAAGFDIIIATTNPGFDPNLNGNMTTKTNDYNTALEADADDAFDVVVSLDAALDNFLDTDLFEGDRVHLRSEGAVLMAESVYPVLLSLLP